MDPEFAIGCFLFVFIFFWCVCFTSMELVERIWYSDGSVVVAYQLSFPAGLAVPRPLMMVEMKRLWPPNGCCCRWRWITKAKVNHSPLGQKTMERTWLVNGFDLNKSEKLLHHNFWPRLWSIQKFQDRYVKMLAFSNRPRDHKISDEDHQNGRLGRFHKDLLDSWKYSKLFISESLIISCYIASLALLAFLAGRSSANFFKSFLALSCRFAYNLSKTTRFRQWDW